MKTLKLYAKFCTYMHFVEEIETNCSDPQKVHRPAKPGNNRSVGRFIHSGSFFSPLVQCVTKKEESLFLMDRWTIV